MSASKIEWTEVTWNPTTGCDRISPGCDNCYAMTMAKRLKAMGSQKYQNDGDPRTSGPGFSVTMHAASVLEPIFKWPRSSRMAFLDSMSDVFHARVTAEFLGQVFATMALTPRHTYQILTKRPNRMRDILGDGRVQRAMQEALQNLRRHGPTLPPSGTRLLAARVAQCPWPLPNVWLGTSIESDEYSWRADDLRATPAAARFLSLEPLLGSLPSLDLTRIDWVIAGGESGPKARPIHPEWVRSIRDRCTDANIAFHFKQWGEWAPGYSHGEGENGPGDTFVNLDGTTGRVWIDDIDGCARNWCGDWGDGSYPMTRRGKHHAGRELDGRTWDEFPNPDGGRASA
jgi:protein gp37